MKTKISAIMPRVPGSLAKAIAPNGDVYSYACGIWRPSYRNLPVNTRLRMWGNWCEQFPGRVRRGIFYIKVAENV